MLGAGSRSWGERCHKAILVSGVILGPWIKKHLVHALFKIIISLGSWSFHLVEIDLSEGHGGSQGIYPWAPPTLE